MLLASSAGLRPLAQLLLLHMHSPRVYCALGTVPGAKKHQVPDIKPLRVTAAPMFCPFLHSFLGHLGKLCLHGPDF